MPATDSAPACNENGSCENASYPISGRSPGRVGGVASSENLQIGSKIEISSAIVIMPPNMRTCFPFRRRAQSPEGSRIPNGPCFQGQATGF